MPNRSEIEKHWTDAWPVALADWSPYVQMHAPKFCWTPADEKAEGLTGSFAMIRLVDHSVIISLRQVVENRLQDYAIEILAHEIGHHVYCPSDLTDNARMLARMRKGLPGQESYAPMVSNLYADLLINDHLQRDRQRRMANCYEILSTEASNSLLWSFYLRIYELLWNLPRGNLTKSTTSGRLDQDAMLGARLIRSYAREWLSGAGRFACLCFPYVVEDREKCRKAASLWCDALRAGEGGYPDGLTSLDADEEGSILHPAEDPKLSGLPIDAGSRGEDEAPLGRVPGEWSGQKTLKEYRSPFEYSAILKESGCNLDEREIAVRYYRERATPSLIPFPQVSMPEILEPNLEGLDVWDPSSEVDRIDWHGTLLASPVVIPGVTTRERLYGLSPGQDPRAQPLDLYVGIDCSGSMGDPARSMSYPILAGAVIALSALRAGAKVKAVLSGEPGNSISTEGFIRNPTTVLRMLVNYLGTGYSFGIHRLKETFDSFADRRHGDTQRAHILIVSDYDMFQMLEQTVDGELGWDVAKRAATRCSGGASFVLQLPGINSGYQQRYHAPMERMRKEGWDVYLVDSMTELEQFAKDFARKHYHTSKPRPHSSLT